MVSRIITMESGNSSYQVLQVDGRLYRYRDRALERRIFYGGSIKLDAYIYIYNVLRKKVGLPILPKKRIDTSNEKRGIDIYDVREGDRLIVGLLENERNPNERFFNFKSLSGRVKEIEEIEQGNSGINGLLSRISKMPRA